MKKKMSNRKKSQLEHSIELMVEQVEILLRCSWFWLSG